MKKVFPTIVLCALITSACSNFECTNIEHNNYTMLIDISDSILFDDIKADFNQNLPAFMLQTPFLNLQECMAAKLTIGALSAKDEIQTASASISLLEKGLSRKEKRKRTNPSPIASLLKHKLDEFENLSRDPLYNSSSTILPTMVKSIVAMDEGASNTLLIFSDMVINNKIEEINFYRHVPANANTVIPRLIDEHLERQLKDKLSNGLEIKIIVVLKDEPKGKVKKKDVKTFWSQCFQALNLVDIQFIDNLSNTILWD